MAAGQTIDASGMDPDDLPGYPITGLQLRNPKIFGVITSLNDIPAADPIGPYPRITRNSLGFPEFRGPAGLQIRQALPSNPEAVEPSFKAVRPSLEFLPITIADSMSARTKESREYHFGEMSKMGIPKTTQAERFVADNNGGRFGVPSQIVVAFVAELTLYEFRRSRGRFPELWRKLEEPAATGVARRHEVISSRALTWIFRWRRIRLVPSRRVPGQILSHVGGSPREVCNAAHRGDGDWHRQVVANTTQQVGWNHNSLRRVRVNNRRSRSLFASEAASGRG